MLCASVRTAECMCYVQILLDKGEIAAAVVDNVIDKPGEGRRGKEGESESAAFL